MIKVDEKSVWIIFKTVFLHTYKIYLRCRLEEKVGKTKTFHGGKIIIGG